MYHVFASTREVVYFVNWLVICNLVDYMDLCIENDHNCLERSQRIARHLSVL